MMKNTFFKLLMILFLFSSYLTTAQNVNAPKKDTFINNLRYGGGVGLSFGNNFFSGTLAPFALYEINPYIMTGVGLNATYSNFNANELFVYGGSLIGIVRPLQELQFSVEFEQLRVNRSFNDSRLNDKYWYPALFLGVGYTTGPVTFGIRYDVLYDDNKSIYTRAYMPFVRILL